MLGANRERQFQSAIGTICVVPRPKLSQLNTDKNGQPVSVQGGSWTSFSTILGIQVKDYKLRNPALVVYRLADGTLLAATPEVIAISEVSKTSQYHDECYITKVSDLQILKELPEDSNPIDISKFVFESRPL
ncbi:hypothetical protein [uncultured Nostoc sp.]|uniref:hypothetical protein n=1 Tax=uncultured Nostoc sp. TaxID=340711 RepID=UPI0035C9999D